MVILLLIIKKKGKINRMEVNRLSSEELCYELLIRGAHTEGSVDAKRQRLRLFMNLEKSGDLPSVTGIYLDSQNEIEICEMKIGELDNALKNFDLNNFHNEHAKVQTRAFHVLGRLNRIADQMVVDAKSRLTLRCSEILNSLYLMANRGIIAARLSSLPSANVENAPHERSADAEQQTSSAQIYEPDISILDQPNVMLPFPEAETNVDILSQLNGPAPRALNKSTVVETGIRESLGFAPAVFTAGGENNNLNSTLTSSQPSRLPQTQSIGAQAAANVQGGLIQDASAPKIFNRQYRTTLPNTLAQFAPQQGSNAQFAMPRDLSAQFAQAQDIPAQFAQRQATFAQSMPPHVLPAQFQHRHVMPAQCAPVDGNYARGVNQSSFADLSDVSGSFKIISRWNLKFNGLTGVTNFIERVEELSHASGISNEQLMHCAVLLFTDTALSWYRALRPNIHTWEQLKQKLRSTYLSSEYEEDLWQDIRNRTQGAEEKTAIFVAQMQNLFRKLCNPPDETTQLRILRRNLLPSLQAQLALHPIASIADLELAGQAIENVQMRAVRMRPPPSNPNLVAEPELMYQRPRQLRLHAATADESPTTHRTVGSSSQPRAAQVENRPVIVCWNCRETGHTRRECSKLRRKYCYRCGKENETIRSCPNCNRSGNASTSR